MYKFQDPYFFLLIPLIIYLFFRKNKSSNLTVPSINNLKSYAFKSKKYLIGKYFIFISCLLNSTPFFIFSTVVSNSLSIARSVISKPLEIALLISF